MLKAEQLVLKRLYEKLEGIDEYSPSTFTGIDLSGEISEDLRNILSIEYNCSLKILPDSLQEQFGNNAKFIQTYLENRIFKTDNILLKARYNHFIYNINKNNKYANKAIDLYQNKLSYLNNNNSFDYVYNRFSTLLKIIISLTENTKYKVQELKNQIHDYLIDNSFHNRIKTQIISIILESSIFKTSELEYMPNLCIKLSEKETEHRFVELNLQLGLRIAVKQKDVLIQRKINELLGDNEYQNIKEYNNNAKNIVIPHLNCITLLKIVQYYKNAKNKEKKNKAIQEYNINKKNCKHLKIFNTIQYNNYAEKQKALNELFLFIIDSSTKDIVFNLIFGHNLLFIPNQYIEEFVNTNADKWVFKLFSLRSRDLNGNEQNTEVKDYLRFLIFSNSLPTTISFVFDIIFTCIANKKLSYSKLAKHLNTNVVFAQELNINRDGQKIPYTWFSVIDIGLKSFFEQCNNLQNNKKPDWRFAIDFLSLKFEGILRDIVELTSGIITKVDNYGNTTDMLLDDLLRDESLMELFTVDDINLFKFTFTNKGYNIRNYVAHSFYKPYDYTVDNALLVLLCILRLAKFNFVDFNRKKKNYGIIK